MLNPTAATAMEAVPSAETLELQKERFDLGVFVGDLVLDEEVTRYDGTQVRCSLEGARRVVYLLRLEAYLLLFVWQRRRVAGGATAGDRRLQE